MTQEIRLMYGDVGSVVDPHASSGSAGPFYSALAQYFSMSEPIDASFTKAQKWLNALRNFRFNPVAWRERRHKSIPTFRRHTAIAGDIFKQRKGKYDYYLQQRALFSPVGYCQTPYAISTDATHAITLRHWPEWSPFSGHELDEWMAYEKEIYDHADLLFPRSQYVADSFINDYQQPADKVHVCGSGLNFNFIPPEHGQYDGTSILFVGYDFKRKGGYNVLKAFSKARESLPGITLTICGPKNIPVELPEGVVSLGTVADRKKISSLYSQSSLFIMPSIFEAWGNVYLEAMAYGVPCIASNYGATPEIISHGVDGLLVDPLDVDSITEAIFDILSHKDKVAQMGNAARQKVLSRFKWTDSAKFVFEHISRNLGC